MKLRNIFLSCALALGILFTPSVSHAQATSLAGRGAPLGNCYIPSTYYDLLTGNIYSCSPTGWTLPSGSGTTVPFPVDAEWTFNDGNGTTIKDISGHGHDATFGSGANAPSWSSYGVVFNSGSVLSATPQFATTNVTAWKSVMIGYCINPAIQNTGITGGSQPFAHFPALFGSSTQDGLALVGDPVSGGAYSGTFQGTLSSIANAGAQTTTMADSFGQCHTIGVTLGSTDAYYIDGVPVASSSGVSSSLVTSTGGYEFGADYFGGLSSFSGAITYAALSVNSVWTAAQVQELNIYIQGKLAQRTMPVYPTFNRVLNNQLIFPGDSLWAGRLGTAVWTTKLNLNNTYSIDNWGFNGMTALDICGLSESRWESSVAPGAPKNYAVFDGGSNDLYYSYAPAQVWASIASCAKKAKTAGAIPIVSTIISRTGEDTNIAIVNASIRAGWRQVGFTALLDNAEDPIFAAGGYSNTTYYQSDGIHLTGLSACDLTTGYGHFCVNASKIINTLDGSTASTPDVTTSNGFVAVDANNYVIQTPTAAATYTLVPCQAITGQVKTIVNGSSSFAITVSPTSPDTIVGTTTVPAGGSVTYTATVSSPTAGGCYWVAN